MFGSARQYRFMEGMHIIRELPLEHATAQEAHAALASALDGYAGDKSDLRFGYWEYGEVLVILAPDKALVPCPVHGDACDLCFAGKMTTEFAERLKAAGN